MKPLANRVVIVTGASRRQAIGAAIVRRIAADGAAIMLHTWAPHDAEQAWGADPQGPQALVDELRGQGTRVEHMSADLADPAALMDVVVDLAGRAWPLTSIFANSYVDSQSRPGVDT